MMKPAVLITIVLAFVAGGLSGFWLSQSGQRQILADGSDALRETGDYKYTNPLLICDVGQAASDKTYSTLSDSIDEYVSGNKKQDETVSVYFRDMNRGGWFGYKEDTLFAPASLIKVPVMIAYYKLAEDNPSILAQKYRLDISTDLNAAETYRSANDLKSGTYSVEELIRAMIVDSDNNALKVLSDHLEEKDFSEIFSDLQLPSPLNNSSTADYISTKQYSYFFRVLYNSSYLGRFYSEKALALLTEPDFPDGLRAGIPMDVPIAQKYGERSSFNGDKLENRELHDCGIVYAPSGPYALCVMTKGSDFAHLEKLIQGVSKIVYDAAIL